MINLIYYLTVEVIKEAFGVYRDFVFFVFRRKIKVISVVYLSQRRLTGLQLEHTRTWLPARLTARLVQGATSTGTTSTDATRGRQQWLGVALVTRHNGLGRDEQRHHGPRYWLGAHTIDGLEVAKVQHVLLEVLGTEHGELLLQLLLAGLVAVPVVVAVVLLLVVALVLLLAVLLLLLLLRLLALGRGVVDAAAAVLADAMAGGGGVGAVFGGRAAAHLQDQL